MPFEIQQACQTLGIHWNDADLIGSAKRAYRKLAKELHPDKSGADTAEQFSAVSNAYTAITNFVQNPQPQLHPHGWVGMHPNFGIGGVGVAGGATIHPQVDVHQHVDANGNVTITWQIR